MLYESLHRISAAWYRNNFENVSEQEFIIYALYRCSPNKSNRGLIIIIYLRLTRHRMSFDDGSTRYFILFVGVRLERPVHLGIFVGG